MFPYVLFIDETTVDLVSYKGEKITMRSTIPMSGHPYFSRLLGTFLLVFRWRHVQWSFSSLLLEKKFRP